MGESSIETILLEHLSIGYRSGGGSKPGGASKSRGGSAPRGGENRLAEDLDISLEAGTLTSLLGVNGAGKSTLMRTIASFIKPLEGSIKIFGRSLEEYSEHQLSMVVGVVLTERVDVRDMKVRELVEMGRAPYTGFWGRLTKRDVELVDEAMRVAGVESFSDRFVATLSDGERQKVMIAKVLAQETPIILLDEPTAFLDFPSKVEVMRMLHSLAHDMGKTILISSHDLELALQISDFLWLLNRESGIISGTPEELALDGRLSTFFEGRGIAFDAATGLFRVEGEFHHAIRLDGCGQKYSMLRKALQRIGVRGDRHVESVEYIETGSISERGFKIHTATGEVIYMERIADVASWVKDNICTE